MGRIKLTKTCSLLIAIQLIIGASCKKSETSPCVSGVRYGFEASSIFTDEREIYSIGDTIYLNSEIPKNLADLVTSQQVNYSNSAGIKGSIGFAKLDTSLRNFVDAYSNFIVLPVKGTFINSPNSPGSVIVSSYIESSTYEFKIAIVPRIKGIYLISVSNLYSRGLPGKNCTDAGFNMTVKNINKHFNLFQYALGYSADALLMKTGYCFRVQ